MIKIRVGAELPDQLNLQAGYRYEQLTFTVFADNALDKEYFVYQDVIDGFGDCSATRVPAVL